MIYSKRQLLMTKMAGKLWQIQIVKIKSLAAFPASVIKEGRTSWRMRLQMHAVSNRRRFSNWFELPSIIAFSRQSCSSSWFLPSDFSRFISFFKISPKNMSPGTPLDCPLSIATLLLFSNTDTDKQAREKHIFLLFPPFYSKDQNKLTKKGNLQNSG